MSETDDTDLLLLIPPNFYTKSVGDKFKEYKLRRDKLEFLKKVNDYLSQSEQQRQEGYQSEMLNTSFGGGVEGGNGNTLAAHEHLTLDQQAELESIEAKLKVFEDRNEFAGNLPSDVSTISNCTVRSNEERMPRTAHGVVHSTPKCPSKMRRRTKADQVVDDVLIEIEKYQPPKGLSNAPHWKLQPQDTERCGQTIMATSSNAATTCSTPSTSRLFSLSDLWGQNHQLVTAVPLPTSSSALAVAKEEQMRRQHLVEKVNQLQGQLLEYEQRISVALQVDKEKDEALAKAQKECQEVNEQLSKLRQINSQLETERESCHQRNTMLQDELTHAIQLASKFEAKSSQLESELEQNQRQSNESLEKLKQQNEEFLAKCEAAKKNEEIARQDSESHKEKFSRLQYQYDKLKSQHEDMQRNNSTLQQQKDTLHDILNKHKNRLDALETEKAKLQDVIMHLTEKESALKKKLEAQQKSLKQHYQQQLEHTVEGKHKQFQETLERREKALLAEAEERETLIGRRAVKHLELINEQNKLEMKLVQEKYNEEIELYRLQLANASKRIDELEQKLQAYKAKRVDIAERLHELMETQWKKALEILVSPKCSQHSPATTSGGEYTDSENNESQNTYRVQKQQHHETPKSSRTVENNLDEPREKCMEQLQAYIELLLEKSPTDVAKFEELFNLNATDSPSRASNNINNHARAKLVRSKSLTKPPWKG